MGDIKKNLSEKDFKRFNAVFETILFINEWYDSFPHSLDNHADRANKISAPYEMKAMKMNQKFLKSDEEEIVSGTKLIRLINELDKTLLIFDKFIDDYRQFDKDAMKIIHALETETKKEKAVKLLEEFERQTEVINQKHLMLNELFAKNELSLKKAEEAMNKNVN